MWKSYHEKQVISGSRVRENNQKALAEIYRIISPAVYRVIRILIKDEDTVNDILQDTYIKGFARLD